MPVNSPARSPCCCSSSCSTCSLCLLANERTVALHAGCLEGLPSPAGFVATFCADGGYGEDRAVANGAGECGRRGACKFFSSFGFVSLVGLVGAWVLAGWRVEGQEGGRLCGRDAIRPGGPDHCSSSVPHPQLALLPTSSLAADLVRHTLCAGIHRPQGGTSIRPRFLQLQDIWDIDIATGFYFIRICMAYVVCLRLYVMCAASDAVPGSSILRPEPSRGTLSAC